MMATFAMYDILNEFVMLFLSVIFLIHIYITRPMLSIQMRNIKLGFLLSIVSMIVHMLFLKQTAFPEKFSKIKFNIIYIIFIVIYAFLLEIIFTYIRFMSYKCRNYAKSTNIIVAVSFVFYLLIMLYPLVTDRLYRVEDGKIILSQWHYIFLLCGVIDAVISTVCTIHHRRNMPRVALVFMVIFGPIDSLVLIFQYLYPTLICFSITYVVPFILFYIIFHSCKYNDIIGTQSMGSLNASIETAIKNKSKFICAYVTFPSIEKNEFDNLNNAVNYESSRICRQIERLTLKMRLFVKNIYTYASFTEVNSDEEAEMLKEKIQKIIEEPIIINGFEVPIKHKMIVIRDNPKWDSYSKVHSMLGYLMGRLDDININEVIEIKTDDIEKFEEYYEVEKVLLDIRSKQDLEDPRVLCYAQPIYSNETNSFRTAEILMRLQNDGKMLFPDIFIPAAEKNECIHVLTKIILNKACKQIKLMENEYDFDAVTVNCSTQELARQGFYQDILDILEMNDVKHEKVRLEITESTTITNYNLIRSNMEILKNKGVSFYLDDFGTGYSNLERIVTYPFSTIKFDKSMLYKALENEKADKLLEILVKFFTQNGIHALVEGVEDDNQCDYASDKGFEFIQGYKFAKPQPVENLVDYFTKKKG